LRLRQENEADTIVDWAFAVVPLVVVAAAPHTTVDSCCCCLTLCRHQCRIVAIWEHTIEMPSWCIATVSFRLDWALRGRSLEVRIVVDDTARRHQHHSDCWDEILESSCTVAVLVAAAVESYVEIAAVAAANVPRNSYHRIVEYSTTRQNRPCRNSRSYRTLWVVVHDRHLHRQNLVAVCPC